MSGRSFLLVVAVWFVLIAAVAYLAHNLAPDGGSDTELQFYVGNRP